MFGHVCLDADCARVGESSRHSSAAPRPFLSSKPRNVSKKMAAKLGEILVRENLLTPQQLREALEFQLEHAGRLGLNLVHMRLGSDVMITAVLSTDSTMTIGQLDLYADGAEGLEVIDEDEEIDLSTLTRMSEDAPVVRLVNVLLADALQRGACDIHVEPYEKEMRIRFRIDGVLYDVMHPPMRLRDALISRIKIMSKLDIAEKRMPQDV